MSCLICCSSTSEESLLLNVASNDDDLSKEYVGTLRGRAIYCGMPTLKSQYCYSAILCATVVFSIAGSFLFVTNKNASIACLTFAGITFVGAVAQLTLTNMYCRQPDII